MRGAASSSSSSHSGSDGGSTTPKAAAVAASRSLPLPPLARCRSPAPWACRQREWPPGPCPPSARLQERGEVRCRRQRMGRCFALASLGNARQGSRGSSASRGRHTCMEASTSASPPTHLASGSCDPSRRRWPRCWAPVGIEQQQAGRVGERAADQRRRQVQPRLAGTQSAINQPASQPAGNQRSSSPMPSLNSRWCGCTHQPAPPASSHPAPRPPPAQRRPKGAGRQVSRAAHGMRISRRLGMHGSSSSAPSTAQRSSARLEADAAAVGQPPRGKHDGGRLEDAARLRLVVIVVEVQGAIGGALDPAPSTQRGVESGGRRLSAVGWLPARGCSAPAAAGARSQEPLATADIGVSTVRPHLVGLVSRCSCTPRFSRFSRTTPLHSSSKLHRIDCRVRGGAEQAWPCTHQVRQAAHAGSSRHGSCTRARQCLRKAAGLPHPRSTPGPRTTRCTS